MSWLLLEVNTTPERVSTLEIALENAGAQAITLYDAADQPMYEPAPGATPLWANIQLTGMFEASAVRSNILEQLHAELGDEAPEHYRFHILAEQNWARAWMENFKPMRFGEQLWICPHHLPPPEPEATIIYLDPGIAFGTGTHPTTRLCLEWLDQADVANKTIIDYGCGSGVLSIAACKLGARQVIAIDNDPSALTATLQNAKANGVADIIQLFLPGSMPKLKADILLANILANTLMMLKPTFDQHLSLKSQIVLSGILDSQCLSIKNHFRDNYTFSSERQKEDWVCLAATKC